MQKSDRRGTVFALGDMELTNSITNGIFEAKARFECDRLSRENAELRKKVDYWKVIACIHRAKLQSASLSGINQFSAEKARTLEWRISLVLLGVLIGLMIDLFYVIHI